MNKSRRVLHVLEATLGGTGRHVLDLLGGLASSPTGSFELHLAFATRRADRRFTRGIPRLREQGIQCFVCDMRRAVHPASDLACFTQLRSYAKSHDIQLIHGHSAKGGYLGRLAARSLPGTRSIYTPHSSPYRLGVPYHGLEIAAGALLTDCVIAVSPSERSELIASHAAPSRRIRLIPNGLPGTAATRREQHERVVVGTVGRLTAQKAPLRFLEVAEEVVRRNPHVTFLWIGEGELESVCTAWIAERGLSERIVLAGWRDDVESALAQMDIFLMLSDYEGSPYALLEAMRAGLPCVVTDVPGSRDIVVHESTGFVLPKDDRPSQVDRLLQLIEDGRLCQRFGESGCRRWQTEYRLEQMVLATETLYRELLS